MAIPYTDTHMTPTNGTDPDLPAQWTVVREQDDVVAVARRAANLTLQARRIWFDGDEPPGLSESAWQLSVVDEEGHAREMFVASLPSRTGAITALYRAVGHLEDSCDLPDVALELTELADRVSVREPTA